MKKFMLAFATLIFIQLMVNAQNWTVTKKKANPKDSLNIEIICYSNSNFPILEIEELLITGPEKVQNLVAMVQAYDNVTGSQLLLLENENSVDYILINLSEGYGNFTKSNPYYSYCCLNVNVIGEIEGNPILLNIYLYSNSRDDSDASSFSPVTINVEFEPCDDLRFKNQFYPKKIVENSIVIYPNPSSDLIKIDLPIEFRYREDLKFSIINECGSLLVQDRLYGNMEIETTNFPPGIYLINVYNEYKVSFSNKFIISR